MNLSIRDVPDPWVQRLRERAQRHHRSLQGELMAILERTVGQPSHPTIDEILERIRQLGLETPAESKQIARGDRDAR